MRTLLGIKLSVCTIFLYHFDDFILIITDPHLVANAASAEYDKTIQNTLAIASLINSL